MGWSYRKSFRSGPFRINFSKSGISYSVGVKGARVNFGPGGTYVSLSSHGISYRKKIDGAHRQPHDTPTHLPSPSYSLPVEQEHTIASGAIEQLTDTDSRDFIEQLSKKSSLTAYVNVYGIFPLAVFLLTLTFTSFSNHTIVTQPASDSTVIRVTSLVGANVRKMPNAKSPIVKYAIADQNFLLADSTNQKWLKVSFHDSVGYINRRFAVIEHKHHDELTESRPVFTNSYAVYLLIAGLTAFVFWIRRLRKIDQRRLKMELHYEMDEQFQHVYRQFSEYFERFSHSQKIWQYLNIQRTSDFKRNAGAGNLIKRTLLRRVSNNHLPLRYLTTNVSIPYLQLNNLELYFLPERLLVKRNGVFAAVFYKNLNISSKTNRFIEEEAVATDATIVGRTWRYVNKNGGPDRRFNNNRQIPICVYSEYTLTSDTGIYEVLTTSKQGAMDAFADFLMQIGNLQTKIAIVQ